MPETVELTVTDIAYGGKGVGRVGGCVVFVPHVLQGERIRAAVRTKHKRYWTADPVEVLDSSPLRRRPLCPLTAVCPGCAYQHAAYEEEVRIKQSQLGGLLRRLGGLEEGVCREPVPSPRSDGYRNRIVVHAVDRDGAPILGYIGHDNRTVFDVPACPLAVAAINERLAGLRANADAVASFQPGTAVTLRWSECDGVVHWAGRGSGGKPLIERTVLGDLRVPRGAFFQVNPWLAERLLAEVRRFVEDTGPRYLIDLYCGVGVFALAGAGAGVAHVLGIERHRASVQAARMNAAALGLDTAEFACGDAARLASGALAAVPAGETAVVLDPPRAGLSRQVVRALLERRPRGLLYVSCAPDTLARDLAALRAGPYRVDGVRLVDMFPRTPHFECIARLTFDPGS